MPVHQRVALGPELNRLLTRFSQNRVETLLWWRSVGCSARPLRPPRLPLTSRRWHEASRSNHTTRCINGWDIYGLAPFHYA